MFKMYSCYGFLFVGSVYASLMALEGSNVETQIVFRAATPITVSVLDFMFLGREMPNKKSMFALFAVAISALCYVLTDAQFALDGYSAYFWVFIYYFLICAEMTIGKYIMSAVKLDNVWASVLLTNGISLPLMSILAWERGDLDNIQLAFTESPIAVWMAIAASCVVGTSIGWASWSARGMVSATSFTLIGVANKILTVLLSVFFLDKHASGYGIIALFCCIISSTQYEQTSLRAVPPVFMNKEVVNHNENIVHVLEEEEESIELLQKSSSLSGQEKT
jgi:GDP-mannose transporter